MVSQTFNPTSRPSVRPSFRPSVSPSSSPTQTQSLQTQIICNIVAATNINSITSYTVWSCTSNVPATAICETTPWIGVTCSSGAVTGFKLSTIGLTGSITSSLGRLSNLLSLDMSFNSLTGSIPSTLGNLRVCTSIFLSNNKLGGTIPASFGQLSSLATPKLAPEALPNK